MTAIVSGWESRNTLLCIINTDAVKSQSKMKGVIYCYHCIPTGKKYIGQTNNESRRKREHFSYYKKKSRDCKFYRAVKKYGWDNFIYGVVEHFSIDELDGMEIYFIEKYDTLNIGYNSSIGGKTSRGYKHTEKTKQLLREMKVGTKHSIETKQKMSRDRIGNIACNKGIPNSIKTRKKISDKLKGKNHPLYGKGHSEKSKLKMSMSFTEERKEKIRQSNKNRKRKYSTFKITFIDGNEVYVNDGIEKWCKGNGYNLGELYKLKRGDKQTNRYRDIIKVQIIEQ